jgi:prepilin-type N-terminal cleavage/methylation domain-containing protein
MKHHSSNLIRGFTLLETVVVIALIALVGGSLSGMINYFYRTNDYVLQQQQAVQSARQGLNTAMNNLREASYGDDGSYPIASAASSSVTFYADLNNSGDIEQVRYYLLNGTLYRGVTYAAGSPPSYAGQPQSTSTIATFVVQNGSTSPIFQYYDSTGTLLTSPINVSLVQSITTTLNIDVDVNRTPGTYTLLGGATLRNL